MIWGRTNLVIVENSLQVVQVRLGPVAELGFGAQIASDLPDVSDQQVLQNLEHQNGYLCVRWNSIEFLNDI